GRGVGHDVAPVLRTAERGGRSPGRETALVGDVEELPGVHAGRGARCSAAAAARAGSAALAPCAAAPAPSAGDRTQVGRARISYCRRRLRVQTARAIVRTDTAATGAAAVAAAPAGAAGSTVPGALG